MIPFHLDVSGLFSCGAGIAALQFLDFISCFHFCGERGWRGPTWILELMVSRINRDRGDPEDPREPERGWDWKNIWFILDIGKGFFPVWQGAGMGFPEEPWLPHPWNCLRPGWTGLGASWDLGKCGKIPDPWNWMIPWIQTILGFFPPPFPAGMSFIGGAVPDYPRERKCGCTIPLLKLDLNWKWSFIALSKNYFVTSYGEMKSSPS